MIDLVDDAALRMLSVKSFAGVKPGRVVAEGGKRFARKHRAAREH